MPFNICRSMSVVASAILYAVACWDNRLKVMDANRLNKLIRKASNIIGLKLDPVMVGSERRIPLKAKVILDNESNPLHDVNDLTQALVQFS